MAKATGNALDKKRVMGYIESFEALDADAKSIRESKAELMSDARAQGYDTKILRKLIALRKQDPDKLHEEEEKLDLYKQSIGMFR